MEILIGVPVGEVLEKEGERFGLTWPDKSGLALNNNTQANRRFIMVQLSELLDENPEAYKSRHRTIADIGKERMRKITRINTDEANEDLNLETPPKDLGFRVFKLSESNFKRWDENETDPEKIKEKLELHISHLDPNATPEDILYELLLKAGFPLTTKVEKIDIANQSAYSISQGTLVICLENDLSKESIQAIAAVKPVQVICLDAAFHGNDQLKTNAVQTMEAAKIEFRTV